MSDKELDKLLAEHGKRGEKRMRILAAVVVVLGLATLVVATLS